MNIAHQLVGLLYMIHFCNVTLNCVRSAVHFSCEKYVPCIQHVIGWHQTRNQAGCGKLAIVLLQVLQAYDCNVTVWQAGPIGSAW